MLPFRLPLVIKWLENVTGTPPMAQGAFLVRSLLLAPLMFVTLGPAQIMFGTVPQSTSWPPFKTRLIVILVLSIVARVNREKVATLL